MENYYSQHRGGFLYLAHVITALFRTYSLLRRKPYSSFLTNEAKERPFRIIKIGLRRDREELFQRISKRVDEMMRDGLLEEVKHLYPFRKENSLNTVGYKELFQYLDGEWSLETAVEKIKRNTRVYAKKQMTWFKRDESIRWFHPDQQQEIIQAIETEKG